MHWLLSFLIWLSLPQAAFAVHPPSKAQWDQIKSMLDEGNKNNTDLATLRETRKATLGNTDDNDEMKKLAYDRDVQYVQAIRLTMEAYGLPPVTGGISKVPDHTKGQRVQWVVTAGDRDARRTKALTGRTDQGKLYADPGLDRSGATFSDGVTVIFPEAFQSPGTLMVHLVHEQEHFKRNTTDADRITANENELAARRADTSDEVKKAFSAFEPGKAGQDFLKGRDRQANEMAETVRLNKASEPVSRRIMRFFGRPLEADQQHSTLSKEQLQAIRERMAEIDRRIETEKAERRARILEVQRLREEGLRCPRDDEPAFCGYPPLDPTVRNELARAGPSPREPADAPSPVLSAPDARVGLARSNAKASDSLRGLAQRACASPGAITQDYLNARFWWVPNGDDYSDSEADGLEDCARRLLLNLLEFNRVGVKGDRLTAAWMNVRARRLQPPPPPPPPPSWSAPPVRRSGEGGGPGLPNDCIYNGPRCIKW